jgi:antitoxin VapB
MTAHETRTFKSGNSVALRLPKSLAIGPDERMLIEQNGDVLTVRRLKDPAEEKRKLLELVEALRKLPAPGEVEKREPIEFPDRPGLY